MANYALQWPAGVPFKGILASANIELIDEWLVKTPNWVDGSTHTLAGTLTLGTSGAGLFHVTGAFKADDADITVTTGKFLTVNSGGTWRILAGGIGTIDGTATVSSTGAIVLASGGELNTLAGSDINIAGDMLIDLGAVATVEGSVDCVLGSVLQIQGTATVFATTAITLAAGSTVSDESTRFRLGPETLSGNGAYTSWRVATAPAATATLTATNGDVYRIPGSLAALYAITLAAPAGNAKHRVTFERHCVGAQLHNVTILNHDGTPIGVLTNGTDTYASITFQYDGTNWFPLTWTAKVTGPVTA